MADIPAIAGSDTGTWKSILNTIIGLINGKFNSRPYIWANDAARTGQAGMVEGESGYQTDTDVRYIYDGTTWRVNARHTEYTATSASVATTTTSSVGTLAIEASPPSNDTALATISTNTLTIATAGIYSCDMSGTIVTTPTGAFYATCEVGSATAFHRIASTAPAPQLGGSFFAGKYLAAGTVLTFTFFHTSAANRTLTSRFTLTKLA